MQSIWCPTPVFVLFRRLVNVVSTLSISHHYLLHRPQPQHDLGSPSTCLWSNFRPFHWLPWIGGSSSSGFALSLQAAEHLSPSPGDLPHLPPPSPPPSTSTPPPPPPPKDTLHRLLNCPVLYDPVRKPRYPIVLCHGLYGFDVRGPSSFPRLRTHYWANVLNVLRRTVGAEVIVTGVPSTGSIAARSESMNKLLQHRARGRAVNFLAHSMGGLDCRYLITHIKPTDYVPVSLTTIGTPHRGSPFMDWCKENLGLGKLRTKEEAFHIAKEAIEHSAHHHSPHKTHNPESHQKTSSFPLSLASLPSSFTTLLLSLLDSPAYANLTTHYLTSVFNPATPNDPSVKYFSVAARVSSMSVWHPLWLPKMVLDGFEEKHKASVSNHHQPHTLSPGIPEHELWGNDGLVTIQSARWGEYLGTMEECDHWALRGTRGMESAVELGNSVSEPEERLSHLGPSSTSSSPDDGDGWAFGDWGRFVKAWKKEEKKASHVVAAMGDHVRDATHGGLAEEGASPSPLPRDGGRGGSNADSTGFFADDVVKASTEKLSAVFDWIVEQVPSRTPASSSLSSSSPPEREEKSELSSKADLERFYVALCRKLYDEGL